jgi:hypothetical protein
MKNYLITLILFSVCTLGFGQESFKKKYKIPNKIVFSDTTIMLRKVTKTKFKDLTKEEKDSIRNKVFPLGSKIQYEIEKNISGKKVKVFETVNVDEEFYKKQVFEKKENVTDSGINGFVKFEKNKLTVNPYLRMDKDGDFGKRDVYFYELENRQTIKLNFTEWTVSALTIPFKYRFKDKDSGISEEFTTDFNANLFIGRTFYGKTSFFHRKDVGNISNTYKWTGGLLLGASTVTLNASNTSSADTPLDSDTEIIKGLGTVGLGLSFSYNKINLGGFVGWDYSIGDDAEKWNYNKEPWIGFAVGYSLFKF